MNYQKIYDDLINRGKNRTIDDRTETHHIIPRCMNGSDDKSNLVDLTPEEHYVAHQLLVKIYPKNNALVKAAAMMIPSRPSNKLYGWLRRKFVVAQSIDQSASGNSQYGTLWITNEITGEQIKINKDDSISQGWVKGRINLKLIDIREKKRKEKQLKKSQEQEYKISQHREWLDIYEKVGFDKFVEITGYKYSKPNLVQTFAKLLPEFKPQNGKKRS
jgi:hypothetical protein